MLHGKRCAARLGFVCFAPISLPNCSSRYHSSRAEERREWMALKCYVCVSVYEESSFGVKEPEWKGTQISDPSRLVRTADKSPDMSPEKTKLPAKAAVVEVAHL